MGLERRPTSGKIFNGSRLIVPGLPVSSVKVFQTSFNYKKGSDQSLIREYNTSITPTHSPTPTPTPTQNIIDAIIVTNDVYIEVGTDLYLKYEE
jgi:hypothetical protein